MKLVFVALLSALSATATITLASSPAKAANAPAAGPLGDLSSYRKIAVDTQKLVDKGELKAAKERIRDLESAWDEAEDKMRPKSEDSWQKVDKAIDRALAKLRAPNPKAPECLEKLQSLISIIDNYQTAK